MIADVFIWTIAAVTIALMLTRPFGIAEAVWTSIGASLLCVTRLIPLRTAGEAVWKGLDVYLFLTGMMLLAELARQTGVFDWLANVAVRHANGSQIRLFTLIYAVGTVVTIFMSNDATAVVLTPAVLAAVRRAKAAPMPYLLTCALIANAASFVLPISNPANLVVFHSPMPPLFRWLAMFAAPSILSIASTYGLLRWYSRKDLAQRCNGSDTQVALTPAGAATLAGIGAVAMVLMTASALRMDLGLPTCIAAVAVAGVVIARARINAAQVVREMSWGVLPLVATLFVIVEAVKTAGALSVLHDAAEGAMRLPRLEEGLTLAGALGLGTNLVNNLPLGLITGAALHTVPFQPILQQVALIGIDLGPNLSITGSLATILWLIAIRRGGLNVSGWQFLKAGIVIMPISLLLSTGAALLAAGH